MIEKFKDWPHIIVPLAICVLADYAAILAGILKIAAAGYLGLQLCAYVLGVWYGMLAHFRDGETYRAILETNTRLAFPLIAVGYANAQWLFSSPSDE